MDRFLNFQISNIRKYHYYSIILVRAHSLTLLKQSMKNDKKVAHHYQSARMYERYYKANYNPFHLLRSFLTTDLRWFITTTTTVEQIKQTALLYKYKTTANGGHFLRVISINSFSPSLIPLINLGIPAGVVCGQIFHPYGSVEGNSALIFAPCYARLPHSCRLRYE